MQCICVTGQRIFPDSIARGQTIWLMRSAWPFLLALIWRCGTARRNTKRRSLTICLIPMLTGIPPTPTSCVTKPSSLVRLRSEPLPKGPTISQRAIMRASLPARRTSAVVTMQIIRLGWPEQCTAAELLALCAPPMSIKIRRFFSGVFRVRFLTERFSRLVIFPQRLRCAPCVPIGVSALRISLIPMGSALSDRLGSVRFCLTRLSARQAILLSGRAGKNSANMTVLFCLP